jgi:diazepam-binding inhibitor (GABA receptor modulator, acyl-CoA-binding protein)
MKPTTFEDAVELTQKFTTRPSNEELLKLYGLYKQATLGDNEGERPGGFDFKAAAKYNAWHVLKGTSQEEANAAYLDLVEELSNKYL